jgi:CubicO group peptidase (beta-lactamase class C family)
MFGRRSLLAALAGLPLAACTFATIVRHGPSNVTDYRIFPSRPLHASAQPFHFRDGTASHRVPSTVSLGGREVALASLLEQSRTLAFIVIKDDAILEERYLNGHQRSMPTLAFSMSKSILSILVGCALDDGLFRSVQQPITDFVPELASRGFGAVTLEHLLQMTSGSNYRDSDFPFARHPRLYYGHDMAKVLFGLRSESAPGQRWIYKSGDNQLLALALSRALAPRTLTDYLQERLWTPLGMEYDGTWSLDHAGGLEKAFCCVAARAVDFAKLGRLYLHGGDWDGRRVVSRAWVDRSTSVDTEAGSPWSYQYQWWIASRERGDYLAWGHLGQCIYVYPQKRVVIVRVGSATPGVSREQWVELFESVAERL